MFCQVCKELSILLHRTEQEEMYHQFLVSEIKSKILLGVPNLFLIEMITYTIRT